MAETRLLRGARRPGTGERVDVAVRDGRIVAVNRGLAPAGGEVIDADGRWLLPGLWDAHVHFGLWAKNRQRLDLAGTASAAQVLARVRERAGDAPGPLLGFGFRRAGWPDEATVADLDAATGERPVVLIGGDAHAGWLNSAAQRALGVASVDGLLVEDAWFAVAARVDAELGGGEASPAELAAAQADAAARGVVGVVDMEFNSAWRTWPARVAAGLDRLRVVAAAYPGTLDAVIAAGHRSGDALEASGLVTMGPLKVITDGSLGTLTAHCRHPYAGTAVHGVQNVDAARLADLLDRGRAHGLSAAVHAIGDAALEIALGAFAASGAAGTVEHAQLTTPALIAELARRGVGASVQPAHLIEDRDLAPRHWPGRDADCFALASMLDAGVRLTLGSDAPVSPLDPWLAMACAVGRTGDERDAWTPAERITPAAALAASTRSSIAPGEPADLVLTDADPLAPGEPAEQASRLRGMGVALTMTAGRITHAAQGWTP